MEKKLLSLLFILSLFFLNPVEGFGQCASSVSISANPGITICAGTAVEFTATPNAGTSHNFQWQLNGNNVGTNNNKYSNPSLSNSDKIKVIVTSENCTTVDREISMTVNASAPVSFNINATKTTICPGEKVTFSHGPITNGGTSPGYQWRINGSAVNGATNSTFQTSNLNQGDLVTLAVSSSVQCATPVPAISTNTLQINVNPLPTLSTTNGAVCATGQTNIDLLTLVTTNGNSSFYTSESNAINKTNSINQTVSPTTQTTYYVRSELNTGCFVTGSIVVSINPLPAVDAGPDQAICPGGSFDLSTIGSGSNRTFYTTQSNANSGSNQINPIVTPSSQTTYYVRSVSTEGCYNTDSVTISINPLPTLSTSNASICASGQTSIDLNSLVTTNGTTTFYTNQTNADNKTNAIAATVSPTSQTTYFVRSELPTGCYSTRTIIISIDALPTLSVTNGSVCASSQTNIDLNTLVTTNGNSVTFHSSQANADSNSSPVNAIVSPSTTTTYYVRSSNSQGCYNTAAIQISIDALPTVNAGADQTICVGTSFDLSTIASGSGTTLSYYTSQANANNKTSPLSSSTVSPTSTTTYYVRSESVAGCYSTDSVIITVNQNATISLTSSNNNQTICRNSPIANIIYSIGGGGTGANVTGLPTGFTTSYNSTTRVYTISGTTSSPGTYNYTITTTGCGPITATGNIIVDAPISVTPVFSTNPDHNPTAICPVVSGLIYSVQPITGATSYLWTFPAGWVATTGTTASGVVTTPTNSVTVNVTSSAATGNQSITVRGRNACGNTNSTSFTSTVNTFTSANAGPDQTVCKNTNSVQLSGVVGGAIQNHNDYDWSANVTGGSFNWQGNNKLSATYTLPTSIKNNGGSVTISLTTKKPSGTCQAATDTMVITVLPDATISTPTNKDQTLCINTAIDAIAFNIGGAGTGATATGLPAGVTGNYSNGVFTLNGTPTASGTFNYTINTTGNCTNQTSTTGTIQIDPITIADAGSDLVACQSSNPTAITLINANVGGGATTGAWSITSGGGSLSSTAQTADPSTITYTPAADFTGEIELTLTTNAPGTCTKTTDSRKIIIELAPTVEAGDPITICQSSSPGPLTLSGATLGGGATTAAWSITSGGGTLSSTAQTANPQNVTYTPAVDFYGEVVLTLTTNAPGPCQEVLDTRIITIDPVPIVDAGPEKIVCQSDSPEAIILTGASVSGGGSTAAWSITSGGGILSNTDQTANPETISYTPAVGFSGIIILTLTTNTPGICTAVSDTREIIVEQEPTVIAGEDISICHSPNPETIILSGATIGGGATTGTWTLTSGEGTLSRSSPTANPQNITFTPATTYVGEIILTLTTDAPGSCEPVNDTKTIIVNPAATIDAGQDITICSNETVTMAGSFGGGATSGIWTTSGSGNFSNNNPDAVYSPSAADINSGIVTLTYTTNNPDGPCEAVSHSIALSIKEEILITTQPQNVGVCVTNPTELSVVAFGDDLSYQWFKGTAPGTEIAGATSATLKFNQATLNDAGIYYVVVGDGTTCSAVTSNEVTLNVNEDIKIETQPVSQVVCIDSEVTFSIAATGAIETYQWRKNGVDISGENSETFIIGSAQLSDSDTYDVVISGSGGVCDDAISAPFTLTVKEIPTVYAGENFEVCSTTASFNIASHPDVENASSQFATSFSWTTTGAGTIFNETSLSDATYSPVDADLGETIIFTLTGILEVDGIQICTDAVDAKIITIIPQPEITAFSYTEVAVDTATEFCETDTASKSSIIIEGNNLDNGVGTFSVDKPELLSINSSTGAFTPNGTPPGVYIITYTFNANSATVVCTEVSRDFTVTIGANPVADFSYDSEIYCRDTRDNSFNTAPVITFDEEGHENADSFTVDNAGLSIDASTGAIDLSNSTAGTYKITRTVDYTGSVEDGCQPVSAEFTITINDRPIPDFTYSATQFCSDDENITAQIGTNAVTGVFSEKDGNTGLVILNAGTGEIDISSSTPGTYTIVNTVNTEGDGCDAVTAEFTITIQKLPDATFSYSAEAFCKSSGASQTPTTITQTGGVFTASAGLVINANGVIDVAASTANDPNDESDVHTVTYTFAADDVCREVSTTVDVRIDAPALGGELTFGEFGRLFTTCEITERSNGLIVDLNLINFYGKIEAWNYKTFSGAVLTVKNDDGTNFTGSTLPGIKIESLGLSETTVFQVILRSGSCTAAASQSAILSVISSDIDPTPVTADKFIVCIEDPVLLSAASGYEQGPDIGEGGAFDNSSITNHGWKIIRSNGTEGNFNSSADNGVAANWLRTNPVDLRTADINNPSSTSLVRYDSGATDGNKGFAAVSGNHPGSKLITPVFSITSMDQAILTFDQAYNLTSGSSIMVEITTNGGVSWEQLYIKTGAARSGNANNFGGGDINSRPENKIEIDLSAYMGMNNLQIRFHYLGNAVGNVWVVDEIIIPNGPANVSMIWKDYTDPDFPVTIGTNFTETWYPSEIGWNTSTIVTTLEYSNGSCETATNSEEIKVFAFDRWTTTVAAEYGTCGNYTARLTATATGAVTGITTQYPTPDGYMGRWVITGGTPVLSSNDPSYTGDIINNPDVTITASDLGTLNVSWELYATAVNEDGVLIANPGCNPVPTPIEVVFTPCIALDFDGEDDYVDLGENYKGNGYSFEAWVKPQSAGGTIISGPNFKITTPGGVTPGSRWFHIAVTGGKLYIDGIDNGNYNPGTGGTRALIGAEWIDGEADKFFHGYIEEVRIWNTALTQDQIQFMMNQRLIANGTQMGEQIPMDVPGALSYSNLAGYYRLISAQPEPLTNSPVVFLEEDKPANGRTPDRAENKVPGVLKNMETNQQNTAPLPYFTALDGGWDIANTWLRPTVWQIPNTGGIDWNIVRTSHNVDANRDITVLGLISEANTLDMIGTIPTGGLHTGVGTGNSLTISHYLKLNGRIDLNGESQLLQPEGSIVDEASSGHLDRDQQGKRNSFIYNYWASPVSTSGSANNGGYTVAGILLDGTNPANPGAVTFRPEHWAADGNLTTPQITISEFWLWKFTPAPANVYSEWKHIGSTGTVKSGEGFTMKGTAGNAGLLDGQNYTFRGKPHNGDINLPDFSVNQNYLIGNPYPSAIDGHEFIRNNIDRGVFDGSLYFWDHFAIENHILKEYIGGYGVLNLTSPIGVPAVSIDERINPTEDISTRKPTQFIPVGQGFMINSTGVNGGEVRFRNSQRIFEADGNQDSSLFLKPEKNEKLSKNKSEDFQRIRLSFSSPIGFRRQILVGAVPGTTDGFDLGYDARLFDDNVEDMYWIQGNNQLVIQGVPDFNKDRVLKLGVRIKEQKPFTIRIDSVENAPKTFNIYLKDKLNDSIHDLRKEHYVSTSEPGTINDRFEIIFFKDEPLPPVVEVPGEVDEEDEIYSEFGISIRHGHRDRELQILNPHQLSISNMYMFDLRGNKLEVHSNLPGGKEFTMPVRNYSAGIYVVQIVVEGRVVSKKIIIKN